MRSDGPLPVLPMTELPGFVREHDIDVAVLAVPDQVATSVFEVMVEAGIHGVLNFTAVELKCGPPCEDDECVEECTIHNVNIGLEIENLVYLVRLKREAAAVGASTNTADAES